MDIWLKPSCRIFLILRTILHLPHVQLSKFTWCLVVYLIQIINLHCQHDALRPPLLVNTTLSLVSHLYWNHTRIYQFGILIYANFSYFISYMCFFHPVHLYLILSFSLKISGHLALVHKTGENEIREVENKK